MKNIITFSICAMLLGLTFANDAEARERRPFSRCAITVTDTGAIASNDCQHGNIVTANIPKGVNPIMVASLFCNFRYTITHTDTTMACVFGLVRK